jgi:hypothetical protein
MPTRRLRYRSRSPKVVNFSSVVMGIELVMATYLPKMMTVYPYQ